MKNPFILICFIFLGTICLQASPNLFQKRDIQPSGLSIICDNISDSGIGSSYEPHSFMLVEESNLISEYNWRFSLKDKQGDYIEISYGFDGIFTIEPISSPEDYFINVNGDLEGRIECDYTLDGEQQHAVPLSISLELKPKILSISDITTINNDQYSFSLTFDVHYVGADYVTVEIEEEYNTTLRDYKFYEPFVAHVITGNITNLYYSWVTIRVSNKYGTTSETLKFPPSYGASVETIPDESSDFSTIREIIVYHIDGRQVFIGTGADFEKQVFKSGAYLIKELYEDGSCKTSKIYF